MKELLVKSLSQNSATPEEIVDRFMRVIDNFYILRSDISWIGLMVSYDDKKCEHTVGSMRCAACVPNESPLKVIHESTDGLLLENNVYISKSVANIIF